MVLQVRDANNAIVGFNTTAADGSGNVVSLVNTEGNKATYSLVVPDYSTIAAAATDVVTIGGSATKTIRITRATVSGVATAAVALDMYFVKRTTANTGGTSASVAANITKHQTSDAAPSATAVTYSVNPTTGTGTNVRAASKVFLPATGTPAYNTEYVVDFTTRNEKGIVLSGVAEQFSFNLNGQTIPAGLSLYVNITFTEE